MVRGLRANAMKAIILCAGYGTRLYPLTRETAKPLLPIRGKPIVEFICDKLQDIEGLNHIYLVTNHRFYEQFVQWQGGYAGSISISVIDDGSLNNNDRLGSIGDLRLVIDKKQVDEDVLVLGGDNMFSFKLEDLIKFSRSVPQSPLIGVYNLNGRMKANKYGVVTLNSRNEVADFVEKPKKVNGSHMISMCMYYFPKNTLPLLETFVKESDAHDRAGDYIRWLLGKGKVYAYPYEGDWFDIGDIESYTQAICTF